MNKLKDTHVCVTVFRLALDRSKQIGDVHLVKKEFRKFLNSSHSPMNILEVWEALEEYSVIVRGPEEEHEEEALRKQVDKFRRSYSQKHGLNWRWDIKVTKEEINYDEHLKCKLKKDLETEKSKEMKRLEVRLGRQSDSATSYSRTANRLSKDNAELTRTVEKLKEQLDEKSKDTGGQDWRKKFTEFREDKEASEQKLKEEHKENIKKISNKFYMKDDERERAHFRKIKSLKNKIKNLESKIKDRDEWVEESNQKYEDADAENAVLCEEIKSLKLKKSPRSVFDIVWNRFRNIFHSN